MYSSNQVENSGYIPPVPYNKYPSAGVPMHSEVYAPEPIIADNMNGTEYVKIKNHGNQDKYPVNSIRKADFSPINTYQEVGTVSVEDNDSCRVREIFAKSPFANSEVYDGCGPIDEIAESGKLNYLISLLSMFASAFGIKIYFSSSRDEIGKSQSVTITTQSNNLGKPDSYTLSYIFGEKFKDAYIKSFVKAVLKTVGQNILIRDYMMAISDALAIDYSNLLDLVEETSNKLYISYQGNEHILVSENVLETSDKYNFEKVADQKLHVTSTAVDDNGMKIVNTFYMQEFDTSTLAPHLMGIDSYVNEKRADMKLSVDV